MATLSSSNWEKNTTNIYFRMGLRPTFLGQIVECNGWDAGSRLTGGIGSIVHPPIDK